MMAGHVSLNPESCSAWVPEEVVDWIKEKLQYCLKN
jgi:hypothetical protein